MCLSRPRPQDGSAASTEVPWPGAPAERGHERPTTPHETSSALRDDARSSAATSAPVWTPSVRPKHASNASSGRDSSTDGTSAPTGNERLGGPLIWRVGA